MAPCHQDLVFPILVPGFAVVLAFIYLGMPMVVSIYPEPSGSDIPSCGGRSPAAGFDSEEKKKPPFSN